MYALLLEFIYYGDNESFILANGLILLLEMFFIVLFFFLYFSVTWLHTL